MVGPRQFAFFITEGLGWRGFLLPRVLARRGWLVAGLGVGIVDGPDRMLMRKWGTLQNGDLLTAAEAAGFDAILTTDQNLQYQQNSR